MRYFILLLALMFSLPVSAGVKNVNEIFSSSYGMITKSCQRKQLATTGHNRLSSNMTTNTWYRISCDDNAGAGVACYCQQGGTSVAVSASTAWVLKANYEYDIFVDATNVQISCQSYSGTPYLSACPLTP